jgi:hypothetical protein
MLLGIEGQKSCVSWEDQVFGNFPHGLRPPKQLLFSFFFSEGKNQMAQLCLARLGKKIKTVSEDIHATNLLSFSHFHFRLPKLPDFLTSFNFCLKIDNLFLIFCSVSFSFS